MNPSPRFKQDAVIMMAIIVVLLLLWRLHTRPQMFGSLGSWAGTNIFGPATLSLISGSGPGTNGETPMPGPSGELTAASNGLPPVRTSATTASSSYPSAIETTPPPHQTLSTNLLHTNGPVTVIAVAPADLVETPPGVTSASNVSEAASIEQRLGQVSAKGGDIQISLSWNNFNDLDLHCIDPSGEEIWFSHPISSRTRGELDVDKNAHPPYSSSPVENIYWPTGAASAGLYKIYVVYYAARNGLNTVPTAFTVRTVVRGWKTYFFKSVIAYSGHQEPKLICTLKYDPSNPDPSQRFGFVQ